MSSSPAPVAMTIEAAVFVRRWPLIETVNFQLLSRTRTTMVSLPEVPAISKRLIGGVEKKSMGLKVTEVPRSARGGGRHCCVLQPTRERRRKL